MGFGHMPVHIYEDCAVEKYAPVSPFEFLLWCGDYALIVEIMGEDIDAVWELSIYEANTMMDCAYDGDCELFYKLIEDDGDEI